MASPDLSQPSGLPHPLPPGFRTIEDIQSMPSHSIKAGTMVSVIGFVKDFLPPVRTNGTDHKCTLEIKDHSVQYMSFGLKVTVFWPLHKMPRIQGVSDAVIIRNARTQMWSGGVQLLAHRSSEFHSLSAASIPTTLPLNATAPWHSTSANRLPTSTELAYVIGANSKICDLDLPSMDEFQHKAKQAMNIKEKFSLLKDVKPGGFHDIMGEVIKVYWGQSGPVTIHLSDYTANSLFYNHPWGHHATSEGRDGDDFGYIKTKAKTPKEWPGPYGKTCIQLTLFDGHADFVREENVAANQWVALKNVQINFGKMGGCLEGFLRGDRDSFEGKTHVRILEHSDEPDKIDARWKEAVSRKRDWWKRFEKQKQDMIDEAAGLGDKRKRGDEVPKKNSKQRRYERRAAMEEKIAKAEAKVAKRLDLNEQIQCSHPEHETVPLHVILQKHKALLNPESTMDVVLPFVVAKYKSNIRVVGYFPDKIEDFAVGRRVSDYDMLSDYSGGEDTDHEEDRRLFRDGKGFGNKKYEWRFALEVEDADPKSQKDRMWLLVDNHGAQGLLNMDATNLRADQDALRSLKEQLCILWGNLEEHKSVVLQQQRALRDEKSSPSSSQVDSPEPAAWRRAGEQPNIDSDEDETSQSKLPAAASDRKGNTAANADSPIPIVAVSNKAFTCCIKQYGAKVNEDDPSKANAGEGKRWKRIFGLFGTQIL